MDETPKVTINKINRSDLQQFGIQLMPCSSNVALTHKHEFLEMAYVARGKAVHTFGDETCTITAGNYFIVDYGETHSYHQIGDEPLLLINILFLPRLIDETLRDCRSFQELLQSYLIRFSYSSLCQPPTRHIFTDDGGEVRDTIQQMLTEYGERRTGFTEMLRSQMIRILILSMRKISRTDIDASNGMIAMLTDYVRSHYSSEICLSALCRQMHYSPAYVSKKFHDETGTSFSVYVQKYRLEQGCRLLANTNDQISKISGAVGYTNTKYFTELFRRHIGITPREYRRRAHAHR